MKKLLVSLALLLSVSANANTLMESVAKSITTGLMQQRNVMGWVVGDTANYNITMMQFIKGTMVMSITAVTATEVTMQQDMDLGFMGKQACTSILNADTAEIKSMTCNGQAQDPSTAGDVEILEQKADTVTVPAGTFECIYIKAKSTDAQGTATEQEQWVNKIVPVSMMVKAIQQSQMGPVVIELASYKKM